MGGKGGGFDDPNAPVTYDRYQPMDFGGNINYGNLPHYSALPGLQGGGGAYMGKNLDAAMQLHPEYFDAAHAHYRPEYAIAKAVRGAGNDPLSVVNALKAAGIQEGALSKYTLPQAWKYNLGMGVPGGSYDAFIKAWESGEGMPGTSASTRPAGMRRTDAASTNTGKKGGGGAPSGGLPPVGDWGNAFGGIGLEPPASVTKPMPPGEVPADATSGGKKGGGYKDPTSIAQYDPWKTFAWTGNDRANEELMRERMARYGSPYDEDAFRRMYYGTGGGKKGGGPNPAPRNIANVGRATAR